MKAKFEIDHYNHKAREFLSFVQLLFEECVSREMCFVSLVISRVEVVHDCGDVS